MYKEVMGSSEGWGRNQAVCRCSWKEGQFEQRAQGLLQEERLPSRGSVGLLAETLFSLLSRQPGGSVRVCHLVRRGSSCYHPRL